MNQLKGGVGGGLGGASGGASGGGPVGGGYGGDGGEQMMLVDGLLDVVHVESVGFQVHSDICSLSVRHMNCAARGAG